MAKWSYLIDGQEVGPVEPAALKQLATSGQLNAHRHGDRQVELHYMGEKPVKIFGGAA
jgi:hypothetical protein